MYSNGPMIDLGTLGGSASYATAINQDGQITGYSSLTGDSTTHAFLYSNGRMFDLGALARYSFGSAINTHNEIVGYGDVPPSLSLSFINHALLFSEGAI